MNSLAPLLSLVGFLLVSFSLLSPSMRFYLSLLPQLWSAHSPLGSGLGLCCDLNVCPSKAHMYQSQSSRSCVDGLQQWGFGELIWNTRGSRVRAGITLRAVLAGSLTLSGYKAMEDPLQMLASRTMSQINLSSLSVIPAQGFCFNNRRWTKAVWLQTTWITGLTDSQKPEV